MPTFCAAVSQSECCIVSRDFEVFSVDGTVLHVRACCQTVRIEMAYLTKAENTLFLSTYLIVLCFGVYQIYLVGDGKLWLDRCEFYSEKKKTKFEWSFYYICTEISTNGVYSGFTTGWKILDVKRDDLDYEWETWKAFSMRNIIWFVSHLTLSECTRSLAPEV